MKSFLNRCTNSQLAFLILVMIAGTIGIATFEESMVYIVMVTMLTLPTVWTYLLAHGIDAADDMAEKQRVFSTSWHTLFACGLALFFAILSAEINTRLATAQGLELLANVPKTHFYTLGGIASLIGYVVAAKQEYGDGGAK